MTRSWYVKIDGKYQWVDEDTVPASPEVHSVIADEISQGLVHPVTRQVYTSKNKYLRDLRREGYEVVGNDLQSRKPFKGKEVITEAQIMDKIQKAEAIEADPAKLRRFREEQTERYYRVQELLNGRSR